HIRDKDISSLTAYIDLKPALDEQTLDARLVSDFKEMANKDYINVLAGLLPSKMTEVFARMSKIDRHRKANSITKEERRGILELLKRFPVRLSRLRDINEAVITAGGVSTKEINPKTMESKIVGSLYFAGETIDIDALTGGYNLQLAFSTAAAAARAVAERAAENTENEVYL
ncbi:MAG: NAD(P)/FAD-dependent oxidoreductase, partial [Clostridia bacterium]|nr:NAD(P)/FAD-dependent oxidoreductase [Clostridia bacterium]